MNIQKQNIEVHLSNFIGFSNNWILSKNYLYFLVNLGRVAELVSEFIKKIECVLFFNFSKK